MPLRVEPPHAGTEDAPAFNHVIQTAIEDVSSGVPWPITAHTHIWWLVAIYHNFIWIIYILQLHERYSVPVVPNNFHRTNDFQAPNHSHCFSPVGCLCLKRFEVLKGSCHWSDKPMHIPWSEASSIRKSMNRIRSHVKVSGQQVMLGDCGKKYGLNLLGRPCQLTGLSTTSRAWGLCPSMSGERFACLPSWKCSPWKKKTWEWLTRLLDSPFHPSSV